MSAYVLCLLRIRRSSVSSTRRITSRKGLVPRSAVGKRPELEEEGNSLDIKIKLFYRCMFRDENYCANGKRRKRKI
jgi:hypothetical protein